MSADRTFFVYILANRSRTLYTGITSNLGRRLSEHKLGLLPGFTRKYRIHRLVYFEHFANARTAIAREKQIKSWRRAKKVALINERNPAWTDLAESVLGDPAKSRSLGPVRRPSG